MHHIRKTRPLTPHFYIVNLGFTGVYTFFLIFSIKHILWVLVRTASTSTKNLCFITKIRKKKFSTENYRFAFYYTCLPRKLFHSNCIGENIQYISVLHGVKETSIVLHGSKERSIVLLGSKERRSRQDYFCPVVEMK